jgi:hypothetical protein
MTTKKRTAKGQTRKREQAIASLLEARTLKEAAEASRVSLRTLMRWLAEPAFLEEYRQAKGALLLAAAGRLNAAAGLAVAVLMKVARDELSPAAARVGAARAILDAAQRDREEDNLAARISKLETLREDA